MVQEIRLPQFGETMEEGSIVKCLVKVGDEVKKGEIIFEIETDKATLDMESPAEGFVKKILATADQTLSVGEPLLILGRRDEEVPQSFIDSVKRGGFSRPATEAGSSVSPENGYEPATIDAETGGKIKGTQEGEKPAAKEIKLGQTIPMSRVQKITAQKMVQSKREKPCFYLTVKADVSDLMKVRERLNRTSEVKISYHDFIMRAVAKGLEKFPLMTGKLSGDTIELAESIGIGLAISVPDGLVAPIVKEVNKKGLREIARESKALIEKAQNNKLGFNDLEGGCITISNLGALGIESFIPIVVPGQCSILGIGQIRDVYVGEGEDIRAVKIMNITLSADHKVVNGAYAAQFLDCVRKLLEDVSTLE